MNLFEYVDAMKQLNTPVAVAAIVMLCLFLAVIIIKMLGGMRRGTWKQIIRTGMTLAAAVISYVVAVILSNSIMGSTDIESIGGFINFLNGIIPGAGEIITQVLSTFNPEVFEYLIILPATLLFMPLLATLIFLLINLILKIVRDIIIKIFGFKKAKTNSQRLGGALLGAIEAFIWIIMFTLPITGLLGIADRACDEALSDGAVSENAEFVSNYEENVRPFTENPAFTFINSLGAQSLSDGIATITVNDERTNLREEILSLVQICVVEIPALDGADFGALTEENKASLDNIIDELNRSPFLSSIVTGVIQSSSGLMNSDLIPIDREGEYAELLASLIDFLEGVTHATLEDDVNTIKEVYYAISDSGVIRLVEESEDADIMALLQEKRKEGDDTLSEIVTILQSNERTAPLVKAMTHVLLSSLSTGIELPDGSTVTVSYDSLKEDMNSVLAVDKESYESEEEYMDALTETLDTALRDNGIELEGEIVDSIAEYLNTEYSDAPQLTDEEFCDVLLYYYDAYLYYIES